MLCTYVVGDTSDCGSSGVGAPQGALSPVWSGQSGLERVVHYSNLPASTTPLVSSHHAVTQADEPSVAEWHLSPSRRQSRNSAARDCLPHCLPRLPDGRGIGDVGDKRVRLGAGTVREDITGFMFGLFRLRTSLASNRHDAWGGLFDKRQRRWNWHPKIAT
jgi:hypothetical protein